MHIYNKVLFGIKLVKVNKCLNLIQLETHYKVQLLYNKVSLVNLG